MHARLRLDLGWSEIALAAWAALFAGRRQRRAERVARVFSPRGDALVTLSARSAFDLYLSALGLARGSEVLVSGLTIPHMVDILREHGLVAVPFELDPATLAPAPGELERLASPRTRAVLFAHLFGQRADLGSLVELAQRSGWLLWEDCAQAYTGDTWRGEEAADLALFSFGLIKTATAIQGGVARVKDADVRARMQALQAGWAVQSRLDYLRRVARAAVLLALSGPRTFALFARSVQRRGGDLDQVLHRATRGFPGPGFMQRLRRRPGAPLLSLLERRLTRPEGSLAARRRALGERLLQGIGPETPLHGRAARERHHWVFALGCDEPLQFVRALRRARFDATSLSSLIAVQPTSGGPAPEGNRRLLARLVYVPLALEASEPELEELVALLRAQSRSIELEPRSRVAGAPADRAANGS